MEAVLQNVVTDLYFRNNFPIFIVEIDNDMETTLIRIGNSRGIIIPSSILKKMGVKLGAKILLTPKEEGEIILRAVPEEEPFTGPFTGPFRALKDLVDEDAWGGRDMDPAEYVRQLRDESDIVDKRIIPEW